MGGARTWAVLSPAASAETSSRVGVYVDWYLHPSHLAAGETSVNCAAPPSPV